jgi:NADPH:quinone reductase-like Zn-dependent oxidoreductase
VPARTPRHSSSGCRSFGISSRHSPRKPPPHAVPAASPQILGRIAQHLADGTLEVPAQDTYDFAPAPEATQALAATHTQGKLALRVA